ncbi:transcriptional regulator [Candidatus Rhodobacter oscarellae]|uniref:Transcriptional regulator n=1 Tax=Candidatus Rhodobacter oscarellae TaxID=1675527 RepID=A0A0J9EA71_9RHOB|nr:MucR family transcriptional regulator [Candidatus Rhodobacter lobularis]KMW59677.1 transcriptional regulator [Candidatus Rhodobacter lobularis]
MSSTPEVERGSDAVVGLAADIVAAYASRNQIAQAELPDLMRSVHATLNGLSGDAQDVHETTETARPDPAVPIDASVTPDAIICLEDGKSFKTLKRHLRSAYDMSPEEYRERWGLSPDYPMVAPNYSAKRSATAKAIGLGRKPGKRPKKKK